MTDYDLIVIGGGPAGLAAAVSASEQGVERVLIIERDKELGGILNQCIHTGFGLNKFGEELTGPEYARRYIDMLDMSRVSVLTDAMALSVSPDKVVRVVSARAGYQALSAKAIVLAMGCRERTRGAIGIPGDRPSGVFTAGAAQRYLNLEGYMCGKRVVILGSGDIGLIMARRMTLEGANVLACVEVMPYSGGLTRNIVQCLNDFDIPLYLKHTVTDVRAQDGRLAGVTVSRVDDNRAPIAGSEIEFECDTLLLSVGLIPENELTIGAGIDIDAHTGGAVVYDNMETSVPGVFACGNVMHVHDLADYVSAESERAGKAAAKYILDSAEREPIILKTPRDKVIDVRAGDNVSYTVPQRIRAAQIEGAAEIYFRVKRVFDKSAVCVSDGDAVIARFARRYMAPGEMERIALPKAILENIASDNIRVYCEEA